MKTHQKSINKENMSVRDYITMALILVLILIIYTIVSIPLSLSIVGVAFVQAASALFWGTPFLLLYTKINKNGVVIAFATVLALIQLMYFWPTTLFLIIGGLIGEYIWRKSDKQKFSTMVICFTLTITFWYLGNSLPVILFSDAVLQILPDNYIDLYTKVSEFIKGPMFFVGLVLVIAGCIAGSYIGRLLLKKHFLKAGIV